MQAVDTVNSNSNQNFNELKNHMAEILRLVKKNEVEATLASVSSLTMSATISDLAKALSKAQAMLSPASKTQVNPYHKNQYADIDDCWDAAREPLTSNGLSVTQHISTLKDHVVIESMLLHSSGQWMKSFFSMRPKDSSPQSVGSCVTYGRRYGFSAVVGITSSLDIDDDANSAQNLPRKEQAKQTQPPQTTIIYDQSIDAHRNHLYTCVRQQTNGADFTDHLFFQVEKSLNGKDFKLFDLIFKQVASRENINLSGTK